MSHFNQNSNQPSNKQIYPPQGTSNSKKVTPADLDKALKCLTYNLIFCAICGLVIIAGFAFFVIRFLLEYQILGGATLAYFPVIFYLLVISPLGIIVGVTTVVHLFIYKGNFNKMPSNWKIALGIAGIIMCLAPAAITFLGYLYIRIR